MFSKVKDKMYVIFDISVFQLRETFEGRLVAYSTRTFNMREPKTLAEFRNKRLEPLRILFMLKDNINCI